MQAASEDTSAGKVRKPRKSCAGKPRRRSCAGEEPDTEHFGQTQRGSKTERTPRASTQSSFVNEGMSAAK
eukprot:1501252-Pyramimonas_sp.AAC.1